MPKTKVSPTTAIQNPESLREILQGGAVTDKRLEELLYEFDGCFTPLVQQAIKIQAAQKPLTTRWEEEFKKHKIAELTPEILGKHSTLKKLYKELSNLENQANELDALLLEQLNKIIASHESDSFRAYMQIATREWMEHFFPNVLASLDIAFKNKLEEFLKNPQQNPQLKNAAVERYANAVLLTAEENYNALSKSAKTQLYHNFLWISGLKRNNEVEDKSNYPKFTMELAKRYFLYEKFSNLSMEAAKRGDAESLRIILEKIHEKTSITPNYALYWSLQQAAENLHQNVFEVFNADLSTLDTSQLGNLASIAAKKENSAARSAIFEKLLTTILNQSSHLQGEKAEEIFKILCELVKKKDFENIRLVLAKATSEPYNLSAQTILLRRLDTNGYNGILTILFENNQTTESDKKLTNDIAAFLIQNCPTLANFNRDKSVVYDALMTGNVERLEFLKASGADTKIDAYYLYQCLEKVGANDAVIWLLHNHPELSAEKMSLLDLVLAPGFKINLGEKKGAAHKPTQISIFDLVAFNMATRKSTKPKNFISTESWKGSQPKKFELFAALSKQNTGEKLSVESDANYNPLHVAAMFGDCEAITALLDFDKDMAFEYDNYGLTPIHYAAFFGHAKAVETLQAKLGKDLLQQTTRKSANNPSFDGLAGGNILHIALVAFKKYSLGEPQPHGPLSNNIYNPIQNSIPRTSGTEIFTKYPHLACKKDSAGFTPLEMAFDLKRKDELFAMLGEVESLPKSEMIRSAIKNLLLQASQLTNEISKENLGKAKSKGFAFEVIEFIKQKFPEEFVESLNVEDSNSNTALQSTVRSGNYELAQFYIESGLIKPENLARQNILHLAVYAPNKPGKKEFLISVIDKHPQLLEQKDASGVSAKNQILASVILEENIDLLEALPAAAKKVTTTIDNPGLRLKLSLNPGETIAHAAARKAGKSFKIIAEILAQNPDLAKKSTGESVLQILLRIPNHDSKTLELACHPSLKGDIAEILKLSTRNPEAIATIIRKYPGIITADFIEIFANDPTVLKSIVILFNENQAEELFTTIATTNPPLYSSYLQNLLLECTKSALASQKEYQTHPLLVIARHNPQQFSYVLKNISSSSFNPKERELREILSFCKSQALNVYSLLIPKNLEILENVITSDPKLVDFNLLYCLAGMERTRALAQKLIPDFLDANLLQWAIQERAHSLLEVCAKTPGTQKILEEMIDQNPEIFTFDFLTAIESGPSGKAIAHHLLNNKFNATILRDLIAHNSDLLKDHLPQIARLAQASADNNPLLLILNHNPEKFLEFSKGYPQFYKYFDEKTLPEALKLALKNESQVQEILAKAPEAVFKKIPEEQRQALLVDAMQQKSLAIHDLLKSKLPKVKNEATVVATMGRLMEISFNCPITFEPIKEPALVKTASSSHYYEAAAIEQWKAGGHKRSPVNNEEITEVIQNPESFSRELESYKSEISNCLEDFHILSSANRKKGEDFLEFVKEFNEERKDNGKLINALVNAETALAKLVTTAKADEDKSEKPGDPLAASASKIQTTQQETLTNS